MNKRSRIRFIDTSEAFFILTLIYFMIGVYFGLESLSVIIASIVLAFFTPEIFNALEYR